MFKKIAIGIFAGLISGLFASGGGMILVPAFIHMLKMDEKLARGTALFSILPMVITSSFFYIKNDFVDIRISVLCVTGGIIGAIIGTKLLKQVSNKVLDLLFISFLFFASIKMLFFS